MSLGRGEEAASCFIFDVQGQFPLDPWDPPPMQSWRGDGFSSHILSCEKDEISVHETPEGKTEGAES